jgi:lipopolysaccharide exporter
VVEPTGRPTQDLTRHTLAGLQWTYLGTVVGAVFQFGMTAVMARLLSPAAFGLVALAGLFLRFVNYFARAGVTQAIVQKLHLSTLDIRAGFTLSAGLGAAFTGVALLAAPLAGAIARDAELVPVLRWLAIGLLVSGLGAPSVALLRRQLRFKPLALIELTSYIVGYIGVGLPLALNGAGVYALVFAMLTQNVVNATGAYVMVRHSVVPTLAREPHRAILGFGARISVIGFLEFLKGNLDTLAVGRWAGTAQLGLYNRGNMIADLPAYHLTNGLSQVLFPSFSSIQGEPRRLREAYLSAVGMSAAIVLPLNAGIAVAAREIVLVLLGPDWTGAIPVVPWLLLASSLSLIGHFAGVVAEAQAALNAKMAIAAGSAASLVLFLWIAEGGPLAGYGAALAASAAIAHLGYVLVLTRTLDTPLRTLLAPYGPAVLGAAIVAATIAGCRWLIVSLVGSPAWVALVAEVVTGAITLALLFRFGPLRVFRSDLARRLDAAGMLNRGAGAVRRMIVWLVGQPPARS